MNININNDFIINFRKYLGVSQQVFADSLGVNKRTIQNIEQGQRGVPKSVIQAVLEKYAQYIKEDTIEEINNIPDKTVYLSKQALAIMNLREYYGLSQTTLAERIGISRQMINEIEQNKKKVTINIQRAIENIYGALENYYDECFINSNIRFTYARKELLNYTENEFAEKLNINVHKLRDIEQGKKRVTEQILDILDKEFLVNKEWILYGKGNPSKVDTAYDTVEEIEGINAETNNVAIPFFPDAQAAAGQGEALPLVETKEVFYCDKRWLQNVIGSKPDTTIVIKAKGNSMDSGLNLKDDIKDGDLLFVDFNNKEVINNKTYIIQQGNNLRVKKLKKEFNGDLYLVSNNEKEYPVEKVTEETIIVGRVKWNISMENV